MKVPSLSIIDLHDKKYSFNRYWDDLSDCNVPIPKTKIIKLSQNNKRQEYPDCPTDKIMDFMETNRMNNAFLRSGHKAAIDRFRDGSLISTKNESAIMGTYNSLMTQHVRNEVPHNNILVVREWIDLDYCLVPNHSHTFEIRFFIENGEILYRTPKNYEYEVDCPKAFQYISDNFGDVEPPTEHIKKIAKKFKCSKYSWSVDAVLDSKGDWWITEMHINGVYYNNELKKWMNVCGHGDKFYNSPKWIHSPSILNI